MADENIRGQPIVTLENLTTLASTIKNKVGDEMSGKQDVLLDTVGDMFYGVKVQNGVVSYGTMTRSLVQFSINTSSWIEEVNTTLGTNYKASIVASCNSGDALNTYYDLECLRTVNEQGILAGISEQNKVCFYSENIPEIGITGWFEVISIA